MNHRPGIHGTAAFNAVFQFPHIPRPVISNQRFHNVITYAEVPSRNPRKAFEKSAYQEWYILSTFSQGRNPQIKNVEPEEKIAAELALADRLLQIEIGGGHDPHVDGNLFCAPYGTNLFFLKCPQ